MIISFREICDEKNEYDNDFGYIQQSFHRISRIIRNHASLKDVLTLILNSQVVTKHLTPHNCTTDNITVLFFLLVLAICIILLFFTSTYLLKELYCFTNSFLQQYNITISFLFVFLFHIFH